jgi:penicillin amidase
VTFTKCPDIDRTASGVPVVHAGTWEEAFRGLGWVHGMDRGGQVALTRVIGQGRVCELLQDSDEALAADVYFRRQGFARDARDYAPAAGAPGADLLHAYCEGLSAAWARHPPFLLRLAGYRPEPMAPADVLLLLKLSAFVGLAESQRVCELFVIEALRRGVEVGTLAELLPALGWVDPELVRGLAHVPPFYPGSRFGVTAPVGRGSNAWAVAGTRTASGSPLLCGDPHLEVNRLPGVGYEVVLHVGSGWVKGLTLPGLPGFLVGRNPDLAWSVTYSCADTSDFFVERCRDGSYLRDGQWRSFAVRRERVVRRRHPVVEFPVYENEHGILEGDPAQAGDYLAWKWSGQGGGGLGSLEGFTRLLQCRTVPEAQATVRAVEIPTLHMIFADREGNIGYQFTGRVPRRAEGWSGMVPVRGWEPGSDWEGFLEGTAEIPSELNPACGFIASANEGRRAAGGPILTNLAMARYRRDRLREVLGGVRGATVAGMCALQEDLFSLEAQDLTPVYLPFVPDPERRHLLQSWDFRYTPDSVAATLFEHLHRACMVEVLGAVLGRDWVENLLRETGLALVLAGYYADILARPDSRWLPGECRHEVLGAGVAHGLRQPLVPWGQRQTLCFRNLFLGGRTPGFLGFDRGPFPLRGSHATVRAGVALQVGGREVAVGPAYHFVTDLAADEAWTNLPGGASERRLSRRYAVDLENWLRGRYKKL